MSNIYENNYEIIIQTYLKKKSWSLQTYESILNPNLIISIPDTLFNDDKLIIYNKKYNNKIKKIKKSKINKKLF